MNSLLGPGGQKLTSAPRAAPAKEAPAAPGGVLETTTRTFVKDVIEASRQNVVLVDFWAPWCGPCKQLAPILEKAVKAFAGAVKLVKMNIDEHPEVAGQLGIRSIPAVIAFRQGQPMDGFVGAQTEAQIRTFLERVAGPATDGVADLVAEGDAARAAGDLDRATVAYGEALQRDPESVAAVAGLGFVSVAAGDLEGARDLLSQLPDAMKRDPQLQALEAAVKLAEQAASLGGAAKLRRAVDADPTNVQARFDLAVALAAEGDRSAAVAELVELMRRDREWNEGAAQKQLIQFFEAWGPADPATLAGRRKMASVLFA
jgi:putative thioredoxin